MHSLKNHGINIVITLFLLLITCSFYLSWSNPQKGASSGYKEVIGDFPETRGLENEY